MRIKILKNKPLNEEEVVDQQPVDAPATPEITFESNPLEFILQKYPTLKETLVNLMTEDFRDYISGIYVMAPKPTIFKIVLHNNRVFYLTFMGKTYEAKVSGKKYYLSKISELEMATLSIADLLTLGTPPQAEGPTEELASTPEEKSTEEPSAAETPAEEETPEELAESKKKFKISESKLVLNEEVPNKPKTIQAVQHIVDKVGDKYGLFIVKSKPNRLGLTGKKDPQFFIDLFKEVFGPDTKIEVFPPRKGSNPSGSFNMYQIDTDDFGQVNIIVSSSSPGGAGKDNESVFIDNINAKIEEAGGKANVTIKAPEHTETFKQVTQVVDSSKTGAGKGDKSDAQFLSGNTVVANISLKQDGGFRWASVASSFPDFIKTFEKKAFAGEIKGFGLQENPEVKGKYLMYNPDTNERITKVVIPDFPNDNEEALVFGPEKPKVIVVGRTWDDKDFTLEGDNITVQASHIYKSLDDIKEAGISPVFVIAQHQNKPIGLDYRIYPANMATVGEKARAITLSYKDIMS